jgi:predicted RNA binding protein YcfA (HicA-like mRNA interferase family)
LGIVIAVKVREIIRLIEAEGWFLHHETGSHRQYKPAAKKGVIGRDGG